MRPEDSPYRPYWWGIGLSSADVAARPDVGTYGRYDYGHLPPVPFPLDGTLEWLARQPVPEEWAVGGDAVSELDPLRAAGDRLGLTLPEAFVRFLGSADLVRRVRSVTACFLDVDRAPVPAPGADGYLVRFLADQQGCVYWYLYLTPDGTDHAVVSSTGWYDSATGGRGGGAELEFCGESFEAFLCRYWLENEIWFAVNEGDPMPDVGAEYIARYQQAGG